MEYLPLVCLSVVLLVMCLVLFRLLLGNRPVRKWYVTQRSCSSFSGYGRIVYINGREMGTFWAQYEWDKVSCGFELSYNAWQSCPRIPDFPELSRSGLSGYREAQRLLDDWLENVENVRNLIMAHEATFGNPVDWFWWWESPVSGDWSHRLDHAEWTLKNPPISPASLATIEHEASGK